MSGITDVNKTDTSDNAIVVGAGVAGTPSGGIVSIQGVSGGTPAPVDIKISGTNPDTGSGIVSAQTIRTTPGRKYTYRASLSWSAPNNATDVFVITGSATKLVGVRKIVFSGVQSTASVVSVAAIKRSTDDTGGTSTTATVVPLDSTNPAGTAVVRAYTANPTLGTAVGNLAQEFVDITKANQQGSTDRLIIEFSDGITQGAMLRGVNEIIAINLGATTLTGNTLNGFVEFTEE